MWLPGFTEACGNKIQNCGIINLEQLSFGENKP